MIHIYIYIRRSTHLHVSPGAHVYDDDGNQFSVLIKEGSGFVFLVFIQYYWRLPPTAAAAFTLNNIIIISIVKDQREVIVIICIVSVIYGGDSDARAPMERCKKSVRDAINYPHGYAIELSCTWATTTTWIRRMGATGAGLMRSDVPRLMFNWICSEIQDAGATCGGCCCHMKFRYQKKIPNFFSFFFSEGRQQMQRERER